MANNYKCQLTEAATAAGVSARTAAKGVVGYQAEGEAGWLDRSSAPRRVHDRTKERTIEVIAAPQARAVHRPEIAELLVRPLSTISRILTRIRTGEAQPLRLGVRRTTASTDDATRLAYAEALTDEQAITAIGFLRRARAFYARHGIHV